MLRRSILVTLPASLTSDMTSSMSDRTRRTTVGPATSAKWQLQAAKAQFSELVDRAASGAPQIVTRRGEELVVVVSVKAWAELEARARPSIKEWLLAPDARTDDLVPPRRPLHRRPSPSFDD